MARVISAQFGAVTAHRVAGLCSVTDRFWHLAAGFLLRALNKPMGVHLAHHVGQAFSCSTQRGRIVIQTHQGVQSIFGSVQQHSTQQSRLAQQQRCPSLHVDGHAFVVARTPIAQNGHTRAIFQHPIRQLRGILRWRLAQGLSNRIPLLHHQPHHLFSFGLVFEVRAFLPVIGIPHPTQHVAWHDQVRARNHCRQIAVEHGHVHNMLRGIVPAQKMVQKIDFFRGPKGAFAHKATIVADPGAAAAPPLWGQPYKIALLS